MFEDKIKWDKKYKNLVDIPTLPSDIVKNYYNLAKKSKALDIACGNGRNSKFLANKGFIVDAIDISSEALKYLKNTKNINPIEADLDNFDFKKNCYDLIICVNYLNRNLFYKIDEALKKDGILIYETFVYDKNLKNSMKREYLLNSNELLHNFIKYEIIYYEEKDILTHKNEKAKKANLVCKKISCR
ncbi:class I SAM-dependent methyltransferase [Nitrosophilus kaiyonis]|uniref:class I SAM-dependent methyltransferase n=1 Tax=Nitrosophilus kaiyonis TaxID=2930200 RepID=UPI002492F586|nr:class I SAM-dependent methyltransferase [Nitrosophilus kaiyonis]